MSNIQNAVSREEINRMFAPRSIRNVFDPQNFKKVFGPQEYKKIFLAVLLVYTVAWALVLYQTRAEWRISSRVSLASRITPLVSKTHLTYLPFTNVRYNWKLAQLEIDGEGQDWRYFSPEVSDPMGDTTDDDPHSDLKAVFVQRDTRYVYVMVESYNPPFLSAANEAMIEIYMFLADEGGHTRMLFGYLQPEGTFKAWIDQDGDSSLDEALQLDATVAWGNVVELKIPLNQLGDPTYIGVPYMNYICKASSGKLTLVDELSTLDGAALSANEPGSVLASIPLGMGGLPADNSEVVGPGAKP
jgi:hypothetical protein